MQSVINLYSARDRFLESCNFAVSDILSEAYRNRSQSDKATIIPVISEEDMTTAWIFDFNTIISNTLLASIKLEMTVLDNNNDLVELKCLSEYNPDEHIFKLQILDLY